MYNEFQIHQIFQRPNVLSLRLVLTINDRSERYLQTELKVRIFANTYMVPPGEHFDSSMFEIILVVLTNRIWRYQYIAKENYALHPII